MSDKRLIDANALGRYISDWQMNLPGDNRPDWNNAAYDTLEDVLETIKNAPIIDPETLRSVAHWEESVCFDDAFWVCSNCKFPSEAIAAPLLYHYCPNCGAKMEE